MRSSALKNRLLALEKKSGAQDVLLHFADGSTRAVRLRDPVAALIASWRRQWARCVGQPQPVNENDAVLDLIASADSVLGSDPFMLLLHEESVKTRSKEITQ